MPPGAEDAQSSNPGLSPLARAELLLTVFVTGGVVLTIEILGTRIVGPVFGVDLSSGRRSLPLPWALSLSAITRAAFSWTARRLRECCPWW